MKNKFRSKKTALFLLILGLLIFIVSYYFFRFNLKKEPLEVMKTEEKTSIPTLALTPTITPTPTLTPEQIAEMRKKEFDQINAKYGPCKYVPILMYHHVMESSQAKEIGASSINVPPEIFRQQMDYLQTKGYGVVGLDSLLPLIRSNSLPAKPVVLTFDDGYVDFYTTVYPILREKNFKAVVFVISQFMGGERYLSWSQAGEMASSGLVLIEDHTLNHLSLPSLDKQEEQNQIVAAKNIIEQNMGTSVRLFAYPYGGSNQVAKEILGENGFEAAVTTIPGWTQCAGLPYDLQRTRVGAVSLSAYGL